MAFHASYLRALFALVLSALVSTAPALSAQPSFIDRSHALPVQHVYGGGWDYFVGGGVAIFDCNGDARPDIFAAGGENPAHLFVNTTAAGGNITFEKAALDQITAVTGAYPLDLDSDDITDLMVLRNGKNMLLRGLGDCRFSAAGSGLGLPDDARWTTAFSATWKPGDSLPTLAIGNYVDATDPEGPFGTCDTNMLIPPAGDSYADPIPLNPAFCPLSILFSDWQRTGTPMLRMSNDRHYYVREGYEQMWQLDPLRELGAADGWDRIQIWGMGIASRDITGDGLADVMLTSMGDQKLMTNTGSGFASVAFDVGTTAQKPFTGDDGRPSTGWHAEFGDIDNDGRADLFIAKGNVDQMPGMAMRDPNNLLMQGQDGIFTEAAAIAGIATTDRARGAGLADLNGDGLLDIVVVNRRAPMEIWQNTTDKTGHWVAIDLRQPAPNTRTVGAFVEIRTGETIQTQEVTIGGGHVGGQLLPLHFGLGDDADATVRVIWPDGSRSDWQPVLPDQIMQITRG